MSPSEYEGAFRAGRYQSSGSETGATVDFLASAVVFASAALHTEVMPQSPQTKPASTIAFALVKSD